MGRASFRWTIPPSQMAGNLQRLRLGLLGAVRALLEVYGARVASEAQENAPWTDRTGHARQGLRSAVDMQGAAAVLALFHTMDYGIYLETRWSGRYAIIMPTLEANYPHLMAALRALVGGR